MSLVPIGNSQLPSTAEDAETAEIAQRVECYGELTLFGKNLRRRVEYPFLGPVLSVLLLIAAFAALCNLWKSVDLLIPVEKWSEF